MTLKTQMTADLAAAFYNTDEYAVSATYKTATIKLIPELSEAFVEGEIVEVRTTKRLYRAITSSVAGAAQGDKLTIGAVTYTITDIGPDLDGETMLEVSKD